MYFEEWIFVSRKNVSAPLWLNRVWCPWTRAAYTCMWWHDSTSMQFHVTFCMPWHALTFSLPELSQISIHTLASLFSAMPPVYSRGARPDYSGTPRGFRTPRDEYPQHTPRGGRSDRPDNRKGYFRREEKETRDRTLEDAFNATLPALQMNTADFKEALCLVLRKRTALQSLNDYHEILNDEAYQKGSKHYSYLFRHSLLTHKDG